MGGKQKSVYKAVSLIGVLIFLFFMTYSPHFDYSYRLHADEWARIAASERLNHEQATQIHSEPIQHTEMLFIRLVNVMSRFSDILHSYQYLAAVFAVLSGLALFALVLYSTRGFQHSFLYSLFAVLAFGSLKSNTNLLGLWFFTPLTMAIPFLFLYSLALIAAVREKKNWLFIIAVLLLFIIALIHPLTAMFAFLTTILYFAFLICSKDMKLDRNLGYIILPFLALALISLIFFDVPGTLRFFYFQYGWTDPQINYNIIMLFGVFPALLAVAGFYNAFRKRQWFFFSWAIVGLVLVTMFQVLKFTYFVPYTRAVYYLLIGLAVLCAFGLDYASDFMKKLMFRQQRKKSIIGEHSWKILAAIALIVLLNAYAGYSSFHKVDFKSFDGSLKNASLYRCLENEERFVREVERCVYEDHNKYLSFIAPDHEDFPVSFLGYELTGVDNSGLNNEIMDENIMPGDKVEILYKWKARKSMEKDYVVFVHFLDNDREMAFNNDHMPDRPASTWLPGETIIDRQVFTVPDSPDIPSGQYDMKIGLWIPETEEIVPMAGQGSDMRTFIGTISIGDEDIG
ncbi:hypothetical protein GF345_01785 [Candidatus Woesearchaeota archaeon]|nr:hypothetical protein [Candidatus Woesearchaeota archaeon]